MSLASQQQSVNRNGDMKDEKPIDYEVAGLENAIDLRCFCDGNTVPGC
jgi:hypothetical protein